MALKKRQHKSNTSWRLSILSEMWNNEAIRDKWGD